MKQQFGRIAASLWIGIIGIQVADAAPPNAVAPPAEVAPGVALVAEPRLDLPAPTIEVNYTSGDIEVKAPAGLRALGIEEGGVIRETLQLLAPSPTERTFARRDLERIAKSPDFALVAIDAAGRSTRRAAPDLIELRSFVRSWHLSPLVPLANPNLFPKISAAQLRDLNVQTAARPRVFAYTPFVDLFSQLRAGGDTHWRAAYAHRTIYSDTERRITLLVGNDDTLRIWVNDEQVIERNLFGAAAIDEHRVSIALKAGRNDLLIEVINAVAEWGFYFRMIDEQGARLHLAPDGRIAKLDDFYDPLRFVRAWQFAPGTEPWPSRIASTDRATELETKLRPLPLDIKRGPFIDLRAHYKGREMLEGRLTHARTTLFCETERVATLRTGSDDTLRVWLNGVLVIERSEGRVPQADDDSTPVLLRAGENTLIVEVGTGNGAWGFYLRFEENGAPLWARNDGTLALTRE